MLRTSNPTLSEKVFRSAGVAGTRTDSMTISGTINKTILLLLLTIASAGWIWGKVMADPTASFNGWMLGGALGGFAVAMIISFKREWAGYLAPAYALLEGLFLGAISAFFEAMYPGLVLRAVMLTLAVMLVMLTAYRSGWIKVTEKFRSVLMVATAGIALAYLATWILGMFGVHFDAMYDSSPLGIGISLVVVAVAALNLLLDFDFVEKGSAANLPKHMEWYAAFGLMVTLVWLYIEMLRLLSRFASRD